MKIAVVGTCASGKTTIVNALDRLGHDAYVVSQEHSIIADLWRHSEPEALVMLECDYETVQARRGGTWPRWLFDLQRERLSSARANADLILDTSKNSVEETLRPIEEFIAAGERRS
jgi:chloramphenicol 3-O-phosphotransferase